MGVSDPTFQDMFDKYTKSILERTNKSIKKIAWLGAPSNNSVGPKTFEQIYIDNGGDPKNLKMDYFDIVTGEETKYWDINSDWDLISGYDLVIAWRVSSYCENADHFSKQLSKILDKNGLVVFDFFMGGPTIIPVMLPSFIRNLLSDTFKINIEEVSAIFSWDHLFPSEKGRRYENYFLLPQFNNLYKKYSKEFKLETGYDISKHMIIPHSVENVLTDEKLSNYGVKVNLDRCHVSELHNHFTLLAHTNASENVLEPLSVLYGSKVVKYMIKYAKQKFFLQDNLDYHWYQPLSPFVTNSHSQCAHLPTKQLHLIVQFEKE
tara:strand:- start:1376 stop:2335 length:960 start_codon:yes stop_codon:yes gene_type:complete